MLCAEKLEIGCGEHHASAFEDSAFAEDIQHGAVGDIPRHLKNDHADSAGAEKAAAYKYPHNYANHYVKQRYLPETLGEKRYYEYGPNKTEQAAKRYWDDIKGGA